MSSSKLHNSRRTQPAGYSTQIGSTVSNPASQTNGAGATCAAHGVPLNGGIYTPDGNSTQQYIAESFPTQNGWTGAFTNNGTFGDSIWVTTICAGT